MTQLKQRAVWSLSIWGVVMIALMIIFFSGGGPARFLEGDSKVTLTRAFFTAGFTAQFLMLFLTRAKPGRVLLVKDERDDRIARQANAVGFYLLLVYVFFLCMFLYWYYKVFQEVAAMPVGWIWFLACSSFFVGYIVQSVATLVLYGSMSGDGEN